MEIRLHVLHGMHFIMYHDDHPIRKRHSSFSSAHKNTKTIAERLQKCPLTVKNVFEKMRLQMPPPLKKRGEKRSLLDLFWGEGCVCIGDRSFHWMWKVGQIGEKTSRTNKSVYVRKGSNICAFIVCFEQHKLPQLNCFFSAGSFTAKISINTFNGELFSLEVYCLCCVLWLIPDSNGASFHYLCYLQIK